ncbi:hypothetical protein IWW38_004199, partial [Coemansia aciculifera]
MRTFTALYTHQKQKKVKAWQEGTARYNSGTNDLVLFDTNNQRIASYRLRAKDSIELSNEYDVGRFLLTLEAEHHESPDTGHVTESTDAADPTPVSAAGALSGAGMPKRARKLPSLIKPMRVKAAVTVATATTDPESGKGTPCLAKPQTTASTTPRPSGEALEYDILYTTQKIKKVKAWTEGTLTFSPAEQRLVLKGEDGGTLTSARLPKSKLVEVGGELDLGIYLIQIERVKGEDNDCAQASVSAPLSLQLQGALKRRHEALVGDAAGGDAAKLPRPGVIKSGLQRIKLQKLPSQLESVEASTDMTMSTSAIAGHTATLAEPVRLLSKPALVRAGSSTVSLPLATRSSAKATSRPQFVPPTSHTPTYLHFPRRGELLQHVSVSKGYGLGPPRQLTVPVSFDDSSEYQQGFAALLRENFMAELSSLAIRYFFMARERFEGDQSRYEGASGRMAGRRHGSKAFGTPSSFPQACKSVGVLLFDECMMRQPFMDSAAFKAQSARGNISFRKGDSITLELSRRENYAGFAKDDTWAVSSCSDFKTESTFLARSVFYGPSKSNTLELMLVGDEDAKVAARLFNSDNDDGVKISKRRESAGFKRKAPVVFAIRCLDSASDWSMLDTVEDKLSAETMPLLPHLLQVPAELPPTQIDETLCVNAILARIDDILNEKRIELGINDEQFAILQHVVMSAVSIYLPVEKATPVTIVHGPFGTGKSFLVSAIVICLDTIAD